MAATSALAKAAAPTVSPPPGYVAIGTVVTLTSATEGDVVYTSTAAGTPPALNGEGKPVINEDTTFRAFAQKERMKVSEVRWRCSLISSCTPPLST
ncbi:MAG: chitobiase/beta-hexosaminidase C-terminal domain-containing protein [Treponematales bacterium]